jgi:hypothetical protein
MVMRAEHVEQSSGTKKQRKHKKQVEVQDIESDEEETYGDRGSRFPRGGEDEVEGHGGGDEGEEEKGGGEATTSTPPPEDTPVVIVTPQNRKVTPKKPLARKKMRTNKPQLEATLTENDISLVCRAMEDAFEDMLQRYEEKHVELYERIERELKEVQQAVRLVRAVPTAPFSS